MRTRRLAGTLGLGLAILFALSGCRDPAGGRIITYHFQEFSKEACRYPPLDRLTVEGPCNIWMYFISDGGFGPAYNVFTRMELQTDDQVTSLVQQMTQLVEHDDNVDSETVFSQPWVLPLPAGLDERFKNDQMTSDTRVKYKPGAGYGGTRQWIIDRRKRLFWGFAMD